MHGELEAIVNLVFDLFDREESVKGKRTTEKT